MRLQDIQKMVKSLRAQTMPASNQIADHWTEGQTNAAPSRRDIGYGPVEAAWGGGAQTMISRYSHPAPQHGQTRTAAELVRDLGETMRTADALQRSIATLTAHTAKLASIAANQRAWPEGSPDDDDLPNDRAKSRARLKALKRAAREADAEAEDADTAADRRRAQRKAVKARTEAAALMTRQINGALEGIGVIQTDIRGIMGMVMGRGKAGGTPPTQIRKAEGRDEILKSVAVAMGHMGPLERTHAETVLRMAQAGVSVDVIKKRLDGIGGNVAIALRPLVEIG